MECEAGLVAMVQMSVMGFLVEMLLEATTAIGQAIRTNDDSKHWIVVKRERQFFQLAVACLNLMESIVTLFMLCHFDNY